jgi:hypothetical protein
MVIESDNKELELYLSKAEKKHAFERALDHVLDELDIRVPDLLTESMIEHKV